MEDTAIIILAAGLGTRMKSNRAKVLHELAGKPMIHFVLETAVAVAGNNVIVVVGHQADIVKQAVLEKANVSFALQEKQLGTGHAVMCALPYLPEKIRKVIILCGDVPLLTPETLKELLNKHEQEKSDITLLAVEFDNPTGYGRVIVDKAGNVFKIIEEADASPAQKEIKLINSGIYCVNKECLENSLRQTKTDNAQQEFYLTDIIEIGNKSNKKIKLLITNNIEEITGVNSLTDLQKAVQFLDNRRLKTS